jgi:NADH:ubiquinone oxidoreductase subunit F (NADH-binding)
VPTTLADAPHRPSGTPAPPAPPPRPAHGRAGPGEVAAIGAPHGARLLAAPRAGRGPSLSEHHEVHGRLPLPGSARREDADTQRCRRRWLLEEVERSGLAGRGGAGFPSARKLVSAGRAGARTVLVNAMEGEPASHKDEVLLATSPHLVLDGAELAALATGASRVVLCLDAGRATLAALAERAIAERAADPARRAAGAPELALARLDGRYVTGEESALAAGAGGGAPVPSYRPDKSVPLRVGRRPAVVHNAETLAHLALLARHGAAWFRATGAPESPGTCLVTVSGATSRPVVLEVPTGTPLRAILRSAGVAAGPAAVLAGGYGGSWLPPEALDCAWSPSGLRGHGAAPGAGVLVALPAGRCGAAETARIAAFMAGESAGRCGPCAFGLPAIAADLQAIGEAAGDGDAARSAMGRLLRRLELVEGRGACRHPDGVARMVRSALGVFATDLAQHLAGRPCAGSRSGAVATLPVTGGR